MEIREMTIEQLEERLSAIPAELEKEDADLDALEQEARDIKAEMETRKAAEAAKVEIREAIAEGREGRAVETIKTEEKPMDLMEIRKSDAYVNAFANYIKTNDDTEVRALLTENVSGTVPVPEIVESTVRTAWAKEGIMSLVRKAYAKGNLKVGFEISGEAAVAHTESSNSAVSQENLVLGICELTPVSLKKWLALSDEVLAMAAPDFLAYVYDEIAYRIAKKAADTVIAKIEACGTVSTTTCPGVPNITATQISVGLVAKALAQLSDEATNPVVMMNKLTWGAIKEAQYANGYNVDPFEGLRVVFNDTISAFSAATTGVTYMIVGDLGYGALANYPEGAEIEMKYDDKTMMEYDLVRILGRQYVGIGVVAPNAFVRVKH